MLTALERDQHLEAWRKLTLERDAQLAHPSGGRQPKDKGHSKTAKEFNTSRRDIERAEKVASLTDEAKEVAREVGLDDNRSALEAEAKKRQQDHGGTAPGKSKTLPTNLEGVNPTGEAAAIAADMLPALQAEAKKRQAATQLAGKDEHGNPKVSVPLNLEGPNEQGEAASEAAEIVGVDKKRCANGLCNRSRESSRGLASDATLTP